jgi:hypothetical protein
MVPSSLPVITKSHSSETCRQEISPALACMLGSVKCGTRWHSAALAFMLKIVKSVKCGTHLRSHA